MNEAFANTKEIIGIRIRIPDHPTWQMCFTPPSHALATILNKTIALLLKHSGQRGDVVAFGGALPVVNGLVGTDSAETTVALLRETFVELGIDSVVHLYRFDQRELIFRPLDPNNAEVFSYDEVKAATQKHQAEIQRIAAILTRKQN